MKVGKKNIVINDMDDLSIPNIQENNGEISVRENENKEWAENKLKEIEEMEEAINTMFLMGSEADLDMIDFDANKYIEED